MSTTSVRYRYRQLNRFCNDAFIKFGFSEDESRIITDVLLEADLCGIESHGIQRLVRYHKGIEKGMIKVDAKPQIVFETPVSAVIDGNEGMGQLLSHFGMETAISKAKVSGIGIVTMRNSNHFGIAGYYSNMACKQGFIGIAMTNSNAIMVPTHGKVAMLGSNPIAISMPAEPYPFCFDASTTVVTRGKLEVYDKLGEPIPEGWALDSNGHDTVDGALVLKNIVGKKGGGIMPLGGEREESGGHKGYGFGILCEIFTSILSQGTTSNKTNSQGKAGICHSFIAIDLGIFGDFEEIKKNFSEFLQELRDAPKAEGASRIYTHGEKEVLAYSDHMENGIDINVNTLIEMGKLADYLGMDPDDYLGKIEFETEYESSYD